MQFSKSDLILIANLLAADARRFREMADKATVDAVSEMMKSYEKDRRELAVNIMKEVDGENV